MSLRSYLQRQFEHDFWANREEVRALAAIENPPAPALKLLAHIVAAQWLWLDRLQQNPQRIAVWPEFSLSEYEVQLRQLEQTWRSYLFRSPKRTLPRLAATRTRKARVGKAT